MSEVDAQQFGSSVGEDETDYRHMYCLISLYTCDVELVLFNLLAKFATHLFTFLMDGYPTSTTPLQSVDAINFRRKLKRRIEVTMMWRLSYRWFQTREHINEVTLLDIKGMVEMVVGDIYLSVEEVKSGAMTYAEVIHILSGERTDDINPFNWKKLQQDLLQCAI